MSGETTSAPDVVAAAWPTLKGCITLQQAKAILAAAQWAGMAARDLAEVVVKVTGAETLDEIAPADFDRIMDGFVAAGFRHPTVPMVTPLQLAALDEGRRRLGVDGRQFVAVVRQLGRVRSRHHLDGAGFLAVWRLFAEQGSGVPVPGHGVMTRAAMRVVHEAAYQQGMNYEGLLGWLTSIGGVIRASQLDERGFLRLLHVVDRLGASLNEPPPIVIPAPGMVTQAQANLVWRLWLDFDGWKGDRRRAALDRAIGSMLGMEGGLASLTRAGARTVIDRFMAPRLADRRRDDAVGRRDAMKKERGIRERRRGRGARR